MRHSNWALVAIAMLVIGLSTTTINVYGHSANLCTGSSGVHTRIAPVLTSVTIVDTDEVQLDWTQQDVCEYDGSGFDFFISHSGNYIIVLPVDYNIEYKNSLPVSPPYTEITNVAGFTYNVDGLESETEYCFEVQGNWATSPSVTLYDSNAICITTPQECEVGEQYDTETEECVAICEAPEVFNPETEECDAVKKGNDDKDLWNTRPTFGVSPTNQNVLVVKCGFGMDQACWDMTNQWHTDFEKVVINIGETHDFQLNMMAQQRLKIAGLCLVPAVGNMEGELCFEMSFDGNGNPTGTKITQKEGLVDEGLITFESSRNGAFYNMKVKNVKFLDKPFFEVIGMYAIDWQPLGTQTFANEGLGVIGEPLTEQPIIQIASNTKAKSGDSGMMTLTRVDKFENVWTTDEGILYTFNEYGTPEKLSPDVMTRITDETEMVMTRTNSNFKLIVDWSTDQAEQKMREMFPNLFKEQSFAEINNIKTINTDYKDTKKILADSLFN